MAAETKLPQVAAAKDLRLGRCVNPEKLKNRHGLVWLNVASATYVEENFVNLDNNLFLLLSRMILPVEKLLPEKYADSVTEYKHAARKAPLLRHDCRKPLPLPGDSVDHILCSHFLEHVFPDEGRRILREFQRVLKQRGTLHMIVPDLAIQVNDYVRKKREGQKLAANDLVEETLLTRPQRGNFKFRVMDVFGQFGLSHRWMYDRDTLSRSVEDAGFEISDDVSTPSDHVRKYDGVSVHVRAIKL